MKRNTTKPIDRVQAVADAYVQAIVSHCEANKLSLRSVATALIKRPQNVRVAKVANFQISGVAVKDLFESEDIYYITNKAYNSFKQQLEVDINGVQNDELLKALQGK